MHQLDQKQSSHVPVGTHHLPTGKTTELFVFSFVPISHISQGLFSRSHPPHLISYPGFVSALSCCHGRAQRCHGEKCQIKAKDLIWEQPNAFHIPEDRKRCRMNSKAPKCQESRAVWSVALATFSLVSPVTRTLIHHPSICLMITPRGPDEDHRGGWR